MELVEWLRVKLDEIAARRRSRGSWFVVSGRTLDVCVRFVPGHYWVRLALSFTGECEPGHAWMYGGCMRRDAWRIGRVGFVVMRLPRGEVPAHRQS